MIEIKTDFNTTKYIEIDKYLKDLKMLGNEDSLEILIHSLDGLLKSEKNTKDNPYFRRVGSLRGRLISILKIVDRQ